MATLLALAGASVLIAIGQTIAFLAISRRTEDPTDIDW
jgi:hypothetical protein